jgi:hypothetical protein
MPTALNCYPLRNQLNNHNLNKDAENERRTGMRRLKERKNNTTNDTSKIKTERTETYWNTPRQDGKINSSEDGEELKA